MFGDGKGVAGPVRRTAPLALDERPPLAWRVRGGNGSDQRNVRVPGRLFDERQVTELERPEPERPGIQHRHF